ncbi:MAG: kelch repeat-containing protein [Isosphaeraceae bacterium]|nr:kelch repeat-containing protein [Isosphaeraceae bacterium]
MNRFTHMIRRILPALVLAAAGSPASAHFLWIRVAPGADPRIEAFLQEDPEPAGPEFLKYVRGLELHADGHPIESTLGEETLIGNWVGASPARVDAESVLGVREREGVAYRLVYTARAQTRPIDAKSTEPLKGLRVRLIDAKGEVEVVFDGKPVPEARIRIYPEDAEPRETKTDARGRVVVPELGAGKAGIFATWIEATPGEQGGRSYRESRHYATLTFAPGVASEAESTKFAEMSAPAVNSFGGAVLDGYLYVYSGHVGRTHHYDVDTTAKSFRRLNLGDRKTWEELPLAGDVQGAALVSDGKSLYLVGGMTAKNRPNQPHDLHSTADFARFDVKERRWTRLASMPRARSTHDAVVIGRTLYVVGGWNMMGAEGDSEFLDDALSFDLDHPEAGWKSIPQPFRRRALSAGELGGKLVVLGGLAEGGKVEREVDIFDPATGDWSKGPALPGVTRADGFGTSAFAVDESLYFSGVSGRIHRLDREATRWVLVGAWGQPRLTHRLLPGPDHTLLAVGGNHNGTQTPLIEAVRFVPRNSASTRAE